MRRGLLSVLKGVSRPDLLARREIFSMSLPVSCAAIFFSDMLTSKHSSYKRIQLLVLMLVSVPAVFGQGFDSRSSWDQAQQQLDRRLRATTDEPKTQEETAEMRIARLKRELLAAEEAALKSSLKDVRSLVDIPIGALVVVSSGNSEGSGFLAEMQGRIFFITNIHVLGAARDASVTTIDGIEVPLGPVAFLSKHRDVAIVPVAWGGPVLKLSMSLNFDKVEIGQAVTVMGNSSGARVATRLTGEIRGIGPREIEVSAKFEPGNSGSPIVHDDLGTVVGVVSHVRDLSAKNKWTEDSELADIRRFGYRLDGDMEWERVLLKDLYHQAEVFTRFADRTFVMGEIGYMMENKSTLLTNYREHESLGYLFDSIDSRFSWKRGTRSSQNQLILKRFINNMISELQNDRAETADTLNLSYFVRQFEEIESSRDQVRRSLIRFSESRLE
jgi:S1-C subfamily serine protease